MAISEAQRKAALTQLASIKEQALGIQAQIPMAVQSPSTPSSGSYTERWEAVKAGEAGGDVMAPIIKNPDGTFSVQWRGTPPTPSPIPSVAGVAPPLITPPAPSGFRPPAIGVSPQAPPGAVAEFEGIKSSFDRIKQSYEQMKASGLPAPPTSAGGRAAVDGALPPATPPDMVSGLISQDPILSKIFTSFQEYMNPQKQKESLVDTYKQLIKDSGIEGLDSELLNTKKIIDGTEDDIRNEVTKAGGFATDSQVLALTFARNKQLIKNYNNLLETRNSKREYLNTMIGLAAQDRTEANRRTDQMFDFAFKIADYQIKMKDNAASQYEKIIKEVGYKGLVKQLGGDPYAISLVERTLGLESGGLNRLASLPQKSDYASIKEVRGGLYNLETGRWIVAPKATGTATSKLFTAQQKSKMEAAGLSADDATHIYSAIQNGHTLDDIRQALRDDGKDPALLDVYDRVNNIRKQLGQPAPAKTKKATFQ